MRDKLKDKGYFEKYLEYQYSRIRKKTEKLNDCEEEKKQRVLLSLTTYEIDLIKAEFSYGADKEKISKLVHEAIGVISDYDSITYEDLLILLSFIVLFGNSEKSNVLIQKNRTIIEKDRLLSLLTSYIEDNEVTWNKSIALVKEQVLLDDVFDASDKENAMLKYLDSWYSMHSEYAWYDSHKKDTDTYCGYWCFEAAAITKILGLNENKLSACDYYPSF